MTLPRQEERELPYDFRYTTCHSLDSNLQVGFVLTLTVLDN
jgi:hypothetical protein